MSNLYKPLWNYACLPIAPEEFVILLKITIPIKNREPVSFSRINPWSAFAALVRANENFRFPYDWKNIQKSAIEH